MQTWKPLETLVERVENATELDRAAAWIHRLVRACVRPGPVEDVLSGTPVGHPIHPALVAVPIGAWASVTVLDLAGESSAARRMTAFGCLAAVPAAASGATDWLSTDRAERRVGLVHALLNDLALTAYTYSWLARRRGSRARGVCASLVGATFLSGAGWLGGHLAYAQGVGVDTTAFAQLPGEWTDAGAETDLPGEGDVAMFEADAIPVLVTRRRGKLVAMADRCTHRGGPLHEGEVVEGCVICPWHGSAFSLDDATVRSGPASRPQPLFEIRVRAGRVEVRREESRTLRTNPVGH